MRPICTLRCTFFALADQEHVVEAVAGHHGGLRHHQAWLTPCDIALHVEAGPEAGLRFFLGGTLQVDIDQAFAAGRVDRGRTMRLPALPDCAPGLLTVTG